MTRGEAEALLDWAHAQNPTPWLDHAYGVARAAEKVAGACGLDKERAWISGLLHDVGNYVGDFFLWHVTAGYRLMMERNEPQIARVCLTHSFPLPRLDSFIGAFDAPERDMNILEAALRLPMDDYDRLIQLCDALSWGRGVCLMEKRLMDVMRRYGANPLVAEIIEARFQILQDFEHRMGHSVYDLFPEAAENTFTRSGK